MEQRIIMLSENELEEKLRNIVADFYQQLRNDIEKQTSISLLSATAVCEILEIDKSTLWRWEKRGYLCPVRIGCKVRYRRSDIDKMINEKN
jgi:predicted DNA-binding transcriptional regulator AlpA